MEKHRLQQIENYVLGFFQELKRTRILAKELFARPNSFAIADLVRALEDLEKKQRLLVRHTSDGNDYVSLTRPGADKLGLTPADQDGELTPVPHPPRSAPPGV